MSRPKIDPLEKAITAYSNLDTDQKNAFHLIVSVVERQLSGEKPAPRRRKPKEPEAQSAE